MDELNELRNQMAAMKQSLENYSIVNQRLMRTVMKQRSGWNNYVIAEIIGAPFLALLMIGLCSLIHISMWIAYTIIIAMILSTYVDWKSTMRILPADINSLSLMELKKKLQKQKYYRKIQLLVELPLSLAWAAWFLIEYLHQQDAFKNLSEVAWGSVIFMVFMLALSAIVVIILYKKAQQTNDRIIDDIEHTDKE